MDGHSPPPGGGGPGNVPGLHSSPPTADHLLVVVDVSTRLLQAKRGVCLHARSAVRGNSVNAYEHTQLRSCVWEPVHVPRHCGAVTSCGDVLAVRKNLYCMWSLVRSQHDGTVPAASVAATRSPSPPQNVLAARFCILPNGRTSKAKFFFLFSGTGVLASAGKIKPRIMT